MVFIFKIMFGVVIFCLGGFDVLEYKIDLFVFFFGEG